MAGLDSICEKIVSDAQIKADEIIKKAKEQANLKKSENEAEMKKIKAENDNISAQKERDAKERIDALISSKECEEILKTENDTIKEIILSAKSRIEKLSKEEYFDLLADIYKANADDREGELLLIKEDRERMDKAFPERLSKIKGKVTLAEDSITSKGFIIRYGKVELNCTLEAIFKDKQNQFFDIASACLKE